MVNLSRSKMALKKASTAASEKVLSKMPCACFILNT